MSMNYYPYSGYYNGINNYNNYQPIEQKPQKNATASFAGNLALGIGATATAAYMIKKGKSKSFFEGIKKAFTSFRKAIAEKTTAARQAVKTSVKVTEKQATQTPAISTQKATEIIKPKPQIISKPPVEKVTAPTANVAPTVASPKPAATEKIITQKSTTAAEKTIPTQTQRVAATVDSTLEAQKANFRKIATSDVCKNSENFLSELKPHSYGADKTMIRVNSKASGYGYQACWINGSAKTFPVKLAGRLNSESGKQLLVTTLSDGRKQVSIQIAAGRLDGARPIQQVVHFISEGKEFSPLQKDIIKIMSAKAKTPIDIYKGTDILSLGIYGGKSGELVVDKDILLSSIETAKQQLAGRVDNKIVDFALNIPKGKILEI